MVPEDPDSAQEASGVPPYKPEVPLLVSPVLPAIPLHQQESEAIDLRQDVERWDGLIPPLVSDLLSDNNNNKVAKSPPPRPAKADNPTTTAKQKLLIPASVLIPFIRRPSSPTILFTVRAFHLRNHAGQVCLPGGRFEKDDPAPSYTALREFEEEMGIPPDKVEVLGSLPPVVSSTGFHIFPFVGLIEPPLQPKPNPAEVDRWFEAPVAYLMDESNWEDHTVGCESQVYKGRRLRYGRFEIWGTTAEILLSFRKYWLES